MANGLQVAAPCYKITSFPLIIHVRMHKFEHERERERWLVTCSAKYGRGTQFFSAGTREFLLERRDIISYLSRLFG